VSAPDCGLASPASTPPPHGGQGGSLVPVTTHTRGNVSPLPPPVSVNPQVNPRGLTYLSLAGNLIGDPGAAHLVGRCSLNR